MLIGKLMIGLKMWMEIFVGGLLWFVIYGMLVFNFCDFVCLLLSVKMVCVGNFWGLLVNIFVFVMISFVFVGV